MEDDFNRLLMYLFLTKGGYMPHKLRLLYKNIDALFIQLHKDDLVILNDKFSSIEDRRYPEYSISINGCKACENLPENFIHRPYSYFLYLKSKKPLSEKSPVLDKVRTGFITFLFSIVAILIGWLCQNQAQRQLNTQQDKRIDTLNDAIKNLQIYMQDSLVKK